MRYPIKKKKGFGIRSLQVLRDMKSIAAGPLSREIRGQAAICQFTLAEIQKFVSFWVLLSVQNFAGPNFVPKT